MLTPAKITNHHFEASGRNAYKAESVDSFISEVAESYEQMFRENGEMFKKINLLAQRLEEYRNDEDNIRNALLTAQRAAEKITREAQEKADKLVAEVTERTNTEHEKLDNAARELLANAQNRANTIISEAQSKASEIVKNAVDESKRAAVDARSDMIKEVAALETMKQEISKFKQQILSQYAAQVELINQLPELALEEAVEESVVEETAEEVVEEVSVEEPVVQEAVVEETVAEELAEETDIEEAAAEDDTAVEIVVEKEETTTENITVSTEDELDVETLRELMEETEEGEHEDDEQDDEDDFATETSDLTDDFIVPDIDEPDNDELEKMVDEFNTDGERVAVTETEEVAEKSEDDKEGFRLKFENIESYAASDSEGNYLDDLDDDDLDDDDDNGGLAAKLKGFFRK